MFADGRYDACIVSAETRDARTSVFGLVITTGARKGETVRVRCARHDARDPIDALGLACTLVVDGGTPRIES